MPSRHRPRLEHASKLGHVPTVRHRMIAQALTRYESPSHRMRDVDAVAAHLMNPAQLQQKRWTPRWTMATAYSPFELEVDPSFPSTRLVFAQISAVMVDLLRLNSSVGPFVNPVVIREAQDAAVIAGVLPSSNLVRSDGTPPRRAFREAVDELMRTRKVEGRSLFEILLEVQAHRPDTEGRPLASLPACPNPGCGHALRDQAGKPLLFGELGMCCPRCDEHVLFTDALRAHETFREYGENGEACGRVMSLAERLISLGFLDHAYARLRGTVGDIALITDGPLALFGEVAKFKAGILGRLQAIAEELTRGGPASAGGGRPQQARHLRRARAQYQERIPPGTIMVPTMTTSNATSPSAAACMALRRTMAVIFSYRSRDRGRHTLTILLLRPALGTAQSTRSGPLKSPHARLHVRADRRDRHTPLRGCHDPDSTGAPLRRISGGNCGAGVRCTRRSAWAARRWQPDEPDGHSEPHAPRW